MQHMISNWRGIVLGVFGVVMFFVYAWFPYVTSETSFYSCDSAEQVETELCQRYGDPTVVKKFNSPDETMNYFWTLRVAEGKPLFYVEELNQLGNPIVHPRSTNTVGEKVVPGSFLGMYLIYGNIARVGELVGIPAEISVLYMTPLFAVIGLLFFFALLKRIFNNNVAFISTILAFIFPGWVYYASRSMYHNVLFVSLLIIGIYFLLVALSKKWASLPQKYVLYGAAGLFVGVALITRTSEIGWVALVVLTLLFAHRKTISAYGLFISLAFCAIAFVPVFATNYQLYGAPLSIGYSTGLDGNVGELAQHPGILFSLLVSPFGFNIKSMILNAYNFLFVFFVYYSWPFVAGLGLWITQKVRGREVLPAKQSVYLGITIGVAAYLIMFYGSWQITDRIDEHAVSMGTSYMRYWLPIYLLTLPFFGLLFEKVLMLTHKVWARVIIATIVLVLIAVPNMQKVYIDSDESLLIVQSNIQAIQGTLLKLKTLVSPDAVIVLGFKQADKIFFPEYPHIITELVNPRDYQTVAEIAHTDHATMYYHFAPQETVDYISERDFSDLELAITTPLPIFGKESLYIIESNKDTRMQDTNNIQ